MLSTTNIDGLSVYRPRVANDGHIELTGGNEAQRRAVRAELDVLMTSEPRSPEFRRAYVKTETLSRAAGIAIGLGRRAEARLREKLEIATAEQLRDTQSVAARQWQAATRHV